MALTNNILNPPVISNSLRKKWTVGLADIKALGAFTTGDVILNPLGFPNGTNILAARFKHSIALTGTGPISAGVCRLAYNGTSLGTGTLDIFAAVSDTALINDITGLAGLIDTADSTPTNVLKLHFSGLVGASTGWSDAATGSVDVWVDYEVLL